MANKRCRTSSYGKWCLSSQVDRAILSLDSRRFDSDPRLQLSSSTACRFFSSDRRCLKTDPRLQTAHDANSADMLGEAAMGERVRV